MPKPQESVMEEVQRKTRALIMTKPGEVGYDLIELAHGVRETKQLALLAAAEESFCMAASVLLPGLRQMREEHEIQEGTPMDTGLHLLEEAMARHNAYAASLK